MTPTRDNLADALSSASDEVSRTEAALDDAERAVRTCPHVFGAFDRDPGSYDAHGMGDDARSAMASLSVAQSALSHVFSGSGVRPTFEEARNALAHLVSVLTGMPDDEAAILQDETMVAVAEREATVATLVAELHALVGPDRADTAAVAHAAAGLHVLRARYGMFTVVQAEACLKDLLDERASLADLRSLWADVLADLGLGPEARPDVLVSAMQQVVALGTEAVLACRRLPQMSRSVLVSFDERRRVALEDRAALVEAYGPGWLSQTASRLRKASDIFRRHDGERNALAVEFAETLGVRGERSATLADMASTVDALCALDTDVEAAKILGASFAGSATDVSAELEMLDRWFWLQDERHSGLENGAVADAALDRDPGALLALERRLSTFLASLSAHEGTYGTGWHARVVDEARIADLTENVSRVHGVGLRGDDAFDRVFDAFCVVAAIEGERSAINALRAACIPLVDDVYGRMAVDVMGYLGRAFPGATFDPPGHMPDLLASVAAGRDAMESLVSSLSSLNGRADYALFDLRSPIAQVADWLPLVLDSAGIRDARVAWTAAHEARDRAEVALAEYDLMDAKREEQEKADRENAAVATKAAAAARAREQADARVALRSAEDALHRDAADGAAPSLSLVPQAVSFPGAERGDDHLAAPEPTLDASGHGAYPAHVEGGASGVVVTPVWPKGPGRDASVRQAGMGHAVRPLAQATPTLGGLIPDVAIKAAASGTDWVESHLSAVGAHDRRVATG